jgi:hypothetical protein
MPVVTSTLEFLLGSWSVDRTIKDHRAGTAGSFTGTATLRPDRADPSRADYVESGTMSYGIYQGPARRELEYRGRPEGTVEVRFADGRLFVVLDLRRPSWSGVHPCRADRYELATEVLDADTVEERWRVRGPAKDYDAVTVLTRSASVER